MVKLTFMLEEEKEENKKKGGLCAKKQRSNTLPTIHYHSLSKQARNQAGACITKTKV